MAIDHSGSGVSHIPTSGGWSMPSNLVAGQWITQNSLQSNFRQAGSYTLEFQVTPPTPIAGVQPVYSLDAIIAWKLENNSVLRRVNVVNGLSITGRATGAQVQLVDTSSLPGAATPVTSAAPYSVIVSASPGTRASTSLPPTLQGLFTIPSGPNAGKPNVGTFLIPAGNTGVCPIPFDAGVVSVEVVGVAVTPPFTTPQPLTVTMSSFGLTYKAYYPNVNPGFVAIAAGSTAIYVTNNDTVDAYVTCTFGIDG